MHFEHNREYYVTTLKPYINNIHYPLFLCIGTANSTNPTSNPEMTPSENKLHDSNLSQSDKQLVRELNMWLNSTEANSQGEGYFDQQPLAYRNYHAYPVFLLVTGKGLTLLRRLSMHLAIPHTI